MKIGLFSQKSIYPSFNHIGIKKFRRPIFILDTPGTTKLGSKTPASGGCIIGTSVSIRNTG
jgi:hypothetical protein